MGALRTGDTTQTLKCPHESAIVDHRKNAKTFKCVVVEKQYTLNSNKKPWSRHQTVTSLPV
jgi:hypothetical protein